ncbi:hypothetical protein EVAR_60667_1 [Eumeta japonica]|uniref:Uncharacterized protein n=1 Tax=Eumeta variegata TaxID=151549 RepID=A0A4C1ZX64_EUMVA|nr:hypothetical protein EVAR_60667_1 [Eumeta japonica]
MAGGKGKVVLDVLTQSLLHGISGGDSRAAKSIRRVKNGKDGLVNTFSDSRSFLEVSTGQKTYHPLAHEAKRDVSEIVAESRAVRLFWVRTHIGIAGNEHADEFARRAALTKKTAADYDRFPLSFAKRVIKAASLEEWQERYAEGSTGEVTKCFFPWMEQAYRVLKQLEITCQIAQTLTGHDGLAHYLFTLKVMDSPYCACDRANEQDILNGLRLFKT